MTNPTIIDLSLGNQAKFNKNNQLFHQDIYQKLAEEIQHQLKRNIEILKSEYVDNINHVRSHHAVLLHGARGAGKTSILINLEGYINNEKNYSKFSNEILFLDPVDPTMLDGHEDFLNIVVGQINKNALLKGCLASATNFKKEEYYQQLERLAEALEGEQNAQKQSGLDRLLAYQSGLDIAQLSHHYFKKVLDITNRKLIILTVDDVDMSLRHGFNVLEVVRKHICSPFVTPIVSGDINLYMELVANQFTQQLVNTSRPEKEKKNQQEIVINLAKEYLRKVFPINLRVRVPGIQSYLNQEQGRNVQVKFNGKSLGDLYAIHQFLLVALNGGVNGEEKSSIDYIPCTARELIQWLTTFAVFLENEFSQTGSSALPIGKKDVILWWTKQPAVQAFKFYQQMGDCFNNLQRPDLREFCKGLAILNDKDTNFNLGDIIYLNTISQLTLNDEVTEYRSNENYSLYLESGKFYTQKDRLPYQLQESDAPFISNLPAIEPINEHLIFSKKYLSFFNKHVLIDNPGLKQQYKFIIKLFSYDDYYTSNQSTNIVFFGRFFELIVTSLIRDIDENWIKNLITTPPYYSIISISGTKTVEIIESQEDDNEHEQAFDPLNELDLFICDLAKNINDFRRSSKIDKVFIDMALISALQSKYFNQINLYKRDVPIKILEALKNNTYLPLPFVIDIARRASYSFKAALGSFEKSQLFIDDVGYTKVTHQNIFAANRLARSDRLEINNAYRDNIKPFEDKESSDLPSFTSLLKNHPIFKLIEFINDNIERELVEAFNSIEDKIKPENRGKISQKNNASVISTRDCQKHIVAAVKNTISREDYNIVIEQHNLSIALSIINDFYKRVIEYTNNLNLNADQVISGANLGNTIKHARFNTESSLNKLLRIIWFLFLEEKRGFTSHKSSFIEQLTKKGVNKELAILFSSGIDE